LAETEKKIKHLHEVIKNYSGNMAVALSGGVDSSFLLSVAREILGDNIIAVTVNADFVSQREIDGASVVASDLGVSHEVINIDFREVENFTKNPPDRCYYCKRHLFVKIIKFAHARGCETVIEASNTDDLNDYRPGIKALSELGVKSPLVEAGFSKEEIRGFSKERGLSNWNRPANACLATRIETGQEITKEKLKQIEEAENYLESLGVGLCRVRHHGALARIEVGSDKLDLIFDPEIRSGIDERFSELGFIYVTVDMEGYKRGSMNKK
jgi:uncharacterized protein